MKYSIFVALLPALLVSAPAAANDWTPVGQVNTQSQNSQPANSALYQELLMQNETMQQEIAELRSQVEEQNHQLSKLKEQQQQRYLDLDKRLSALLAQPKTRVISKPKTDSNRKDANKLSADELYDQAMAAIKVRDFDSAIADFSVFQKKYAKHSLMPNALYWSGEASYSTQNLASAEQSFNAVIEKHSKHSKAPGAMYKLALIKAKQGSADEAKALLDKVVAHKQTSPLVMRQAKKQLSKYN